MTHNTTAPLKLATTLCLHRFRVSVVAATAAQQIATVRRVASVSIARSALCAHCASVQIRPTVVGTFIKKHEFGLECALVVSAAFMRLTDRLHIAASVDLDAPRCAIFGDK
jgi:hypothetical protein